MEEWREGKKEHACACVYERERERERKRERAQIGHIMGRIFVVRVE